MALDRLDELEDIGQDLTNRFDARIVRQLVNTILQLGNPANKILQLGNLADTILEIGGPAGKSLEYVHLANTILQLDNRVLDRGCLASDELKLVNQTVVQFDGQIRRQTKRGRLVRSRASSKALRLQQQAGSLGFDVLPKLLDLHQVDHADFQEGFQPRQSPELQAEVVLGVADLLELLQETDITADAALPGKHARRSYHRRPAAVRRPPTRRSRLAYRSPGGIDCRPASSPATSARQTSVVPGQCPCPLRAATAGRSEKFANEAARFASLPVNSNTNELANPTRSSPAVANRRRACSAGSAADGRPTVRQIVLDSLAVDGRIHDESAQRRIITKCRWNQRAVVGVSGVVSAKELGIQSESLRRDVQ